jgi:hypothetical protein
MQAVLAVSVAVRFLFGGMMLLLLVSVLSDALVPLRIAVMIVVTVGFALFTITMHASHFQFGMYLLYRGIRATSV